MGTFLVALVGLVLFALVANRLGGAKAHYLETFELEPGEARLWEDPTADAYVVLRARAAHAAFRKQRRSTVVVTNRRILVASKALFDKRHMVLHVLYPSDRPQPPEAQDLVGGQFRKGYVTLVFEREAMKEIPDGVGTFIDLPLSPTAPSSMNLAWYRIYTERGRTFVLPD